MNDDSKPVIGITLGDINGIGPEIVIKTLSDQRILNYFTPVIYGSTRVLSYYKKMLNSDGFNYAQIKDRRISKGVVNVVNCWEEIAEIQVGVSTKAGGVYALKSLEKVVSDAKSQLLNAIVTCPINKENIQSDDFKFPGHTEYLQKKFESKNVLMFMVSESLKVGVATGHIPLKDVASMLNKEDLIAKIKLMEKSLKEDFGIQKPKIAVLGLNPHAGNNGVIGEEDNDITSKAIESLKKENRLIFGPFPADGFFGSEAYTRYDAIMAMYHDQGMIPFKALVFGSGVNFTAGLPITRTSPDHGTAYSIAGKNMADTGSFREAIFTALKIIKYQNELKPVSG